MKKILPLLLFISLLSSSAYCQENRFKVEISIPKNLTNYFFKKSKGGFWVTTKIKNISQKNQKIHYLSCSYDDSWLSSHPDIIIKGRDCDKNFVAERILKPNEEFVRGDLLVSIPPKVKVGKITFQLGFDPDLSLDQMQIIKERLVWSNSITILITPEMLKFLSGGFTDCNTLPECSSTFHEK